MAPECIDLGRSQNGSFRRFEDVFSSQSLGLVLKKLNPTQQRQATQEENDLLASNNAGYNNDNEQTADICILRPMSHLQFYRATFCDDVSDCFYPFVNKID